MLQPGSQSHLSVFASCTEQALDKNAMRDSAGKPGTRWSSQSSALCYITTLALLLCAFLWTLLALE